MSALTFLREPGVPVQAAPQVRPSAQRNPLAAGSGSYPRLPKPSVGALRFFFAFDLASECRGALTRPLCPRRTSRGWRRTSPTTRPGSGWFWAHGLVGLGVLEGVFWWREIWGDQASWFNGCGAGYYGLWVGRSFFGFAFAVALALRLIEFSNSNVLSVWRVIATSSTRRVQLKPLYKPCSFNPPKIPAAEASAINNPKPAYIAYEP